MKKYILGASVFCLILSIGCKKNLLDKNVYFHATDATSLSFIKVFVATVKASNTYVYADNVPLTGARLSFQSTFPTNLGYATITPGQRSISIRDTTSTYTQVPAVFNQVFNPGQYYSLFIYDTLNNTKYLVVKDNIIVPADTSSQIRFANLVFSQTPVPNVDVFSKDLNKNVFTNLSVGSVTDFISFPSKVVDTLIVQPTGTSTALANIIFTPGARRSYTVVFNGRYQTTTGAIARTLSLYSNQ